MRRHSCLNLLSHVWNWLQLIALGVFLGVLARFISTNADSSTVSLGVAVAKKTFDEHFSFDESKPLSDWPADEVFDWIPTPNVAVVLIFTHKDFERRLQWWIDRWRVFPPCGPGGTERGRVDLVFLYTGGHHPDGQPPSLESLTALIDASARRCFRDVKLKLSEHAFLKYGSASDRFQRNNAQTRKMNSAVCGGSASL